MTIDSILADVIRREGGYVDEDADRGGPTNYGITQATLGSWRGNAVTAGDVRQLAEDEAREIYERRYVVDPGFDTLPDPLRGQVVDDGVLSGPRTAVRGLQRALRHLGAEVAIDGHLGPRTRALLRRYESRAVHARLIQVRAERIGRIVQRDPTQARFLRGWLRRVTAFAEDLA